LNAKALKHLLTYNTAKPLKPKLHAFTLLTN
jgi:hypothetical protein